MGRVLCAWEFGGDLGHIRRLSALARELKSTGHEPVLALSDLAAAPIHDGFEWHQAPVLAIEPRPDPGSLNATDLLLHLGFSDAIQVTAALRGWRALLDLVKPDVVVADYAPGALLAARTAGIACVNVGSGFSSPPPGEPMPAFRSWQPVPDERLRAFDAQFLATMNIALAAAKARPLEKARDMFEADLDLLCTFAELDPFGPREGREYFGPLDHGAGGARGAWRTDLHPRIFAYLKPGYRHLEALATALAQTGGESAIAAPGIDATMAARIAQPGLQVHAEPVDLETLLPTCDLCIGHSGSGFTGRSLAAGVPLGLLPMHLEQYLIARRAGDHRVALFANPEEPPPDFALWLHRLAADDAMRTAARALGVKYAAHSGDTATQQVAARIAALLGG